MTEHHRLRYRRRTVYFALALTYGLQQVLQPCLLRVLSCSLVTTRPGAAFGAGRSLNHSVQQAQHLPLWVGAALPAAVLADIFGPAAVLALSLGGSALAVLLLPLVASSGSGAALACLLGASSLLQGATFPCIVALQVRWIPRDRLDDIWVSRTLSVGAVLVEIFVNAAPMAWAPAFDAHPRRWRGTTMATATLAGLLSGCAILVGLAGPHTCSQNSTSGSGAQELSQPVLSLRAILGARPVQATLMSALAAGSALGVAETFLPTVAVQQGIALVRLGDLALGRVENRLRSGARPLERRRVRQLASTLAPLSAAVGLLCLVPRKVGSLRRAWAWPGLATLCLFFQSPMGFGAGFGCSYREVGGQRHAAVLGALGSIFSTVGAALAPQVVMWLHSKGVGWDAAFMWLVVQQIVAAWGWWRYCSVQPLG